MEETTTDDLSVQVRTALGDRSTPLWLPRLTTNLARIGWRKLDRDLGLERAAYGTARVLHRNPEGPRRVVATVAPPSGGTAVSDGIPVEVLPESVTPRFGGSDMRFFSDWEILDSGLLGCVKQALELLSAVPTVVATVCSLVRALHLIDAKDDEVDVSFSEPDLPFSAFVSVPGSSAVGGTLRVAEALLHEAMHLQLTLVEAIVPLVRDTTDNAYFSPWRNEYRTARGVLHALYVFRVIDAFLSTVPPENRVLTPLSDHAAERRISIASQVRQIDHFRECVDLTPEGVVFVDRLLGGAASHSAWLAT